MESFISENLVVLMLAGFSGASLFRQGFVYLRAFFKSPHELSRCYVNRK